MNFLANLWSPFGFLLGYFSPSGPRYLYPRYEGPKKGGKICSKTRCCPIWRGAPFFLWRRNWRAKIPAKWAHGGSGFHQNRFQKFRLRYEVAQENWHIELFQTRTRFGKRWRCAFEWRRPIVFADKSSRCRSNVFSREVSFFLDFISFWNRWITFWLTSSSLLFSTRFECKLVLTTFTSSELKFKHRLTMICWN